MDFIASGATARIAGFICEFDEQALSAECIASAAGNVLDTLGAMVAGGKQDVVRSLERALPPLSQEGVVWLTMPWSARRYRADDAAVVLGAASHALDYDDVSMICVCHPSAPVLSAMLAAIGCGVVPAQSSGRALTGRAFIAAYCLGTEVMIRVGQAMGLRHYELGFHATATLGNLGATAAIARLAGLGTAQTAHAMAIAASMAGGLRSNFGTMVKPLHVGLAAANGVRAVQLARAGIEGAADIFESGGFLRAFSGGATDNWPAGLVLGAPFALQQPGFEQKRYPCCYLLHKIIEATLALRREHGVVLDDVKEVLVRMPRGGTQPLNHPFARTGLHGKFSAPYAVVASLVDGCINLASFQDAAVLRRGVQSRLADVVVIEEGTASNEGSDLGKGPVTVDITLRNGRLLSKTISLSPGSSADPITCEQLKDKWIDCFAHGLPQVGSAQARALFEQGMRLGQMAEIKSWLACLFGP